MSMKESQEHAVYISNNVKDIDERCHHTWIVTAFSMHAFY